ncbi:MAG: N-acetylmuramoyl-L-alanine amidase, partial [Clostridia bacterium]|nr:N-acetylmuramoyl-L-alanine amidase [Clostridia bacterium]
EANHTNFKKGRSEKIKYIVIHYTANNGDTAKDNIDYYSNTPNLSSSAHYFVDEKEICKSVEEKDTAWHCGSKVYKHNKCRNSNSIGIEMCSRYNGNLRNDKKIGNVNFGNYYFKRETVLNAVLFTKELMKQYGISAENVIRHYDVTGKNCPAPFVENDELWKEFKTMLNNISSANDIDYALKWKYGISFDSVENEKEFINLLDIEKKKNSKLYWVFHKLANK